MSGPLNQHLYFSLISPWRRETRPQVSLSLALTVFKVFQLHSSAAVNSFFTHQRRNLFVLLLLLLWIIPNVLLRVYSAALAGTDGQKRTAKKDAAPKKNNPPTKTKMEQIFGFKAEDLTSWQGLVLLLNRPTDPAALGIFRCLFGELTQAQLGHP